VLGTEPEIIETYVKTGQVKIVFNPMLDHGDLSLQAHQAAECAGEQGRFWPMHDHLFFYQSRLFNEGPKEVSKELAAELELDTEQFNTCMDEQRYAELVQSQDEHRRELGIRTRPTLDVNGQFIVGPQSFNSFQVTIDSKLAQ
jgi:protein-disulfide isomerase